MLFTSSDNNKIGTATNGNITMSGRTNGNCLGTSKRSDNRVENNDAKKPTPTLARRMYSNRASVRLTAPNTYPISEEHKHPRTRRNLTHRTCPDAR